MGRQRVSAADVGDLGSGLLERLAETIGEDDALRLSIIFGGRQLYIPVTPQPDSDFVQAIGMEAARRLARRHGGTFCSVPRRAGEHARIILLRRSGRPIGKIAAELDCTERHVYAVLRQYKQRGGTLPPVRRRKVRRGAGRRDDQHPQCDLFEEGDGQ